MKGNSVMKKWYTTLKQIDKHTEREEYYFKRFWETLLKGLNKTKADDEPLHILKILDIVGWDDATLVLECFEGVDKELTLFAVELARERVDVFDDEAEKQKCLDVLSVAERYAYGNATKEELASARELARKSDWESAWSAGWANKLNSSKRLWKSVKRKKRACNHFSNYWLTQTETHMNKHCGFLLFIFPLFLDGVGAWLLQSFESLY
jgi:hypothetical protein